METPRWKIITPSQFEHERRALDFIRAGLPDHDPYRAWAVFEFQSNEGAIYEVDLLVLTKQGFWLVEIKSWRGRIEGDAGTWTRTQNGKTISEDNPVLLANRKAKALSSLLKAQAATKKIRMPWLDAVVFLSADDLQCDLTGPARNRVFLADRKASESQRERKGILNVLLNREGQSVDPSLRSPIDSKIARAISKALDEAGIRPSQKSRRVGDYVLGDLISDGPGYQDRLAKHVAFKDQEVFCRVRQYTVAQACDEETRRKLQRAAAREFQIIQSLNHPGILPVLDCSTQVRRGNAALRSPVGTAEFSRGRKPTVQERKHNAKPRSGDRACAALPLSPLRGLPCLRPRYRGLAPTAKFFRRYAANAARCVGRQGRGPGLPGRATSVALKGRHSRCVPADIQPRHGVDTNAPRAAGYGGSAPMAMAAHVGDCKPHRDLPLPFRNSRGAHAAIPCRRAAPHCV